MAENDLSKEPETAGEEFVRPMVEKKSNKLDLVSFPISRSSIERLSETRRCTENFLPSDRSRNAKQFRRRVGNVRRQRNRRRRSSRQSVTSDVRPRRVPRGAESFEEGDAPSPGKVGGSNFCRQFRQLHVAVQVWPFR